MRIVFFLLSFIFSVPALAAQEAQKTIEVFPSTPFYRYIIYENLVIFWLAIIGLLVVIGMKLGELERLRKMGFYGDNKSLTEEDGNR